MTVHDPHDSTLQVGLVDGCDRCAEHAEHPFDSLDDKHIVQLATMVMARTYPRTNNEAKALRIIEKVILSAQRLKNLGVEI